MTFNEWVNEQIRIVEESLPKMLKTLKDDLVVRYKKTPLIISSDKGNVAILTPDYKELVVVSDDGDKFNVVIGKTKKNVKSSKDVFKMVDKAIDNIF